MASVVCPRCSKVKSRLTVKGLKAKKGIRNFPDSKVCCYNVTWNIKAGFMQNGDFGFYLEAVKGENDSFECEVRATLRLLSQSEAKPYEQGPTSHLFNKTNSEKGYIKFISKELVSLLDEGKGYVENNSMQLEIDMEVVKANAACPCSRSVSTLKRKLEQTAGTKRLKSYANLLQSGDGSDCTLLTKDGKRFSVHKVVLFASSPVFQAMLLSSGMQESESGTIKVNDIGSQVMGILLRFFYTGQVGVGVDGSPVTPSVANAELFRDIFLAADKYDVEELKKFADRGLVNCCSFENALDMFKMVRKLGAKEAEKAILEFIEKQMQVVLEKWADAEPN